MTMMFTLSDLGRLGVTLIDSLVEKLRRVEVHRLQMMPEVGFSLIRLETCVIKIRDIISAAENSFTIATDQMLKLELDEFLMQLKDTVYDGEDLVEMIEHHALHHGVDQHQYEASSQSSSSFNSSATKSKSASSPVHVRTVVEVEDSHVYKLRKIYLRLDKIATALVKIIQVVNSVDADDRQKIQTADSISSNATSFWVDGKVYGRDGEFNTLRQLLLKPSIGSGSSNGSLSVIGIFGVGGVGKTTLAQQLYSDTSITEYFQLKIWVCLSENFSVKRLTKEILQSANIDIPDHKNLDMLQVEVKKKIASKRFLLVIDDLWNNMHGWDMLCASLRSGVSGSKILLTSRFLKFSFMASNECAFHLDSHREHVRGRSKFPPRRRRERRSPSGEKGHHHPPLIGIAKKMVRGLNGLPLEARMLASLLNTNMDVNHWSTIMNNEIWQIPEYGLVPVLQISYHYLPVPLKQCFAFCSLFPRGYWFTEEKLIRIWNAEGFIVPQANRRMEDVGKSYFQELVNRSFFQRLPHKSLQEEQTIFYVMHDLIHDLAERVSIRESYRASVEVPYLQDLYQTLRHLSIFGEFVEPKRSMSFFINKRLRTLILSRMKEPWFETISSVCIRLKCIRVLILHDCGMIELPRTISRLIHLRYLDISDNFGIQQLPESLSYLHNLQYFDLSNCQVQTFPAGITNLINLRQLISEDVIISKINNIGKLINLQTLPTFKVLKRDGHNLTELSSLTQLHGRLRILNLENVEDKMEASAAKLHDKVHLHELVLAWTSNQNSSLDDTVLHASEQILEELQPHSKLRSLTIRGYSGAKTPSWLHTETLASLETLRLENCGRWEDASFIRQMLHLRSLYLNRIPAMKQTTQELFGPPMENKFFQGLKELVLEGMDLLEELSSLGNLPCLKILHITGMPAVRILGLEFYGFTDQGNHFPCLEELKFNNMSEWEEWSWTEDSELFPCLHVLKIEDCPKLRRLPPLPPSLTTLELWQGGLSELPGLWNKINGSSSNMTASLSKLYVSECPNLRMPEQGLLFHDLPNIESIEIHECQELLWLPVKRFKEFTSLKNLSIKNCPMLMSSTEYKSNELLLPPSIQKLTLLDCGNLSETLPHCLRNLPSISHLEFGHPPSQG
ncbi:putative disease resistance protein RGA1 [Curcuma longa]|uniref:putative disease resistance protein RGA1 n=1 Tax=Curcuma longa TaxID=136217 RepID=UPI003D9E5B74